MSAVEPVGEKEAVDLGDVHPFEQMRIRRAIRPAVGGDPMDTLVDPAYPVDRTLRIGGGAERRHRKERTGALQPAPRIAAVVGMFRDARHRQRMQRLQEQRAQTTDEHRGVGMHPADRAVFGEPARPRRLVNARPVGRSVRSGNHAEQAAAQGLAHNAEVRQHRHAFDGTRMDRRFCQSNEGLIINLGSTGNGRWGAQ